MRLLRPSDADLIHASLRTPESFAAVFDRHADAIYGHLARRLGRQAAEDAFSEVFRIAFEARATYQRERANARPWLYGIATNVIARHRTKETRRLRALARAHTTSEGVTPDHSGDVDSRLEASRELSVVAEALLGLPPAERDTLLLISVEGLSYREAAEALSVPIGTVRSRVSRARSRLSAALEPHAMSLSEPEDVP